MIKLIKSYFDGFKYPEEMRPEPEDDIQMTMIKFSFMQSHGIENGLRAGIPFIIAGFIWMSVIFFKHL